MVNKFTARALIQNSKLKIQNCSSAASQNSKLKTQLLSGKTNNVVKDGLKAVMPIYVIFGERENGKVTKNGKTTTF